MCRYALTVEGAGVSFTHQAYVSASLFGSRAVTEKSTLLPVSTVSIEAGTRAVIALDPGLRTGIKTAALDQTGKLLETETLYTERSADERGRAQRQFLELCRRYYRELGTQLAPLQITRGGNIILVQLENEYGSYGEDKKYLEANRRIIREAGFDVELYTCDGQTQMPRGVLPGVLPAVNGLDSVPEVISLINRHHDGSGPYLIAEWYPAWFDSWGLKHHVVPAAEYAGKLDSVLAHGLSINMYMAHGGTTRGFMNGANAGPRDPYRPQTSSYDYDAPINEAGNATAKYLAFRKVISRHLPPGAALPSVPADKRTMTVPPLRLQEAADLFASLPEPVRAERPLSFEDLHQVPADEPEEGRQAGRSEFRQDVEVVIVRLKEKFRPIARIQPGRSLAGPGQVFRRMGREVADAYPQKRIVPNHHPGRLPDQPTGANRHMRLALETRRPRGPRPDHNPTVEGTLHAEDEEG